MTPCAASYIIATLISLILWVIIFQVITAGSRQICEQTTSVDVCQWELR